MPHFLNALLRRLFVVAVAWPVMRLWLGTAVRHRARLPAQGPAIVVANHNSHLDILALLTLFPLRRVPAVHTVAASDYFFKTKRLRWFAERLVGIIPVARGAGRASGPAAAGPAAPDPLEACYRALEAGQVLVVFPEGTRGRPGELADFKSGIWHLAGRFPAVPVVPVYLHEMGRAMPKGAPIAVPLNVGITVGEPLFWFDGKEAFLNSLREQMLRLQDQPADE